MTLQLIDLKYKGEQIYLLNRYPSEIKKNGILEFHVKSKGWIGWQKAKKGFKIVEGVDMPDVWDKSVTWLDVAKFYDQYGIEVADQYADKKQPALCRVKLPGGTGLFMAK